MCIAVVEHRRLRRQFAQEIDGCSKVGAADRPQILPRQRLSADIWCGVQFGDLPNDLIDGETERFPTFVELDDVIIQLASNFSQLLQLFLEKTFTAITCRLQRTLEFLDNLSLSCL